MAGVRGLGDLLGGICVGGADRMKMATLDTPIEPRPMPRWPRGTCFAWELLRGCRKGPMLDGTGPLLCLEIEEHGGSAEEPQQNHRNRRGDRGQ
jgi:hypothetical protein